MLQRNFVACPRIQRLFAMESTPVVASSISAVEPRAAPSYASCWGAQFQLSCGAECTPDFIPGKRHRMVKLITAQLRSRLPTNTHGSRRPHTCARRRPSLQSIAAATLAPQLRPGQSRADSLRLAIQPSAACSTLASPSTSRRHFKSKFCDGCRDSILVPLTRVRALSAELAACFVNKRSEGFWNRAPKNMGGAAWSRWPPRQVPQLSCCASSERRLTALGSSALPGRGPAAGVPATASGARASRLRSRQFHCV